uniref:Uncharacterized protein n=1 Tax=Timema poppense TaxID=170557 RepID=A0A7R9DWM9_TIMPO|nr:unnamed protein product [Timema poppensis]
MTRFTLDYTIVELFKVSILSHDPVHPRGTIQGSMWTLLGLHTILQSVVWILPQTEAIKTLRNLLLVGKPVLPVTLALVIPSAWAAGKCEVAYMRYTVTVTVTRTGVERHTGNEDKT